MEDFFTVKDLYEPIDMKKIPIRVLESKWNILSKKTVTTIKLCVDLSVLQHVVNDTNAYDLRHKLSSLYERNNAPNKAPLMRKIVRLKYIYCESIVVHINTFMGLVNQLAAAKFPLDDALQTLLLLCRLPYS